MRKVLFLLLLSTITSCLNTDELNLNKFDEFVIEPEVLLPFVQIDFSDKFYQQILDSTNDSDSTEMEVEVFKRLDLSDNVDSIYFNFTTFNNYPIQFNEISIIFMKRNGDPVFQINMNDIPSFSPKDFRDSIGPTEIADLMGTEGIKVIMSWEGNTKPYPKNDKSFYFKLNSDLVLKTNIDVGK